MKTRYDFVFTWIVTDSEGNEERKSETVVAAGKEEAWDVFIDSVMPEDVDSSSVDMQVFEHDPN